MWRWLLDLVPIPTTGQNKRTGETTNENNDEIESNSWEIGRTDG
jgi:hypothetical protein